MKDASPYLNAEPLSPRVKALLAIAAHNAEGWADDDEFEGDEGENTTDEED